MSGRKQRKGMRLMSLLMSLAMGISLVTGSGLTVYAEEADRGPVSVLEAQGLKRTAAESETAETKTEEAASAPETEEVAPETEDPSPKPEAEDPSMTPETEEKAPIPEEEGPTPTPETEDSSPIPETEEPEPTPGAEDPTPAPEAQNPGEGEEGESAENNKQELTEEDESKKETDFPQQTARNIYVPDTRSLPDNEELLKGYVERLLCAEKGISLSSDYGRSGWKEAELAIYSELKNRISTVAGNGGSTVFEVISGKKITWNSTAATEEELGREAEAVLANAVDCGLIVDCLIADCPYELYWFDRNTGCELAYHYAASEGTGSISNLTFTFYVASGYQAGSNTAVNAEIVRSAKKAAVQALQGQPAASVTIGGTSTTYSVDDTYTSAAEALQAAWEEAKNAGTANVTLLADIDMEGGMLEVPAGSSIIMEGGSYTLSGRGSDLLKVAGGSFTLSSGKLENTGSGGRTVTVSSGDAVISGGEIANPKGDAVYVTGTGSVTITDGAINARSCVDVLNSGSVTISGGTLTSTVPGEKAIWALGNLTITGGVISGDTGMMVAIGGTASISGTAKIIGTGTDAQKGSAAIWLGDSSSTVSITGGEIIGGNDGISAPVGNVSISGSAIVTGNNRGVAAYGDKLTVNGGEISGKYGILAYGTEVEINNGKVSGTSHGVYAWTGGSVRVNGGEISGGSSALYVYEGNIDVFGGKASGKYGLNVKFGSAALYGGTFTGTDAAVNNAVSGSNVGKLLAEDYAYYKGADAASGIPVRDGLEGSALEAGTYTVAPDMEPIAAVTIGEKTVVYGYGNQSSYQTAEEAMKAAWENAKAGDSDTPATVTLLKNVEVQADDPNSGALEVPAGSSIILEGGSYTLSSSQTSLIEVTGGSFILSGGTLKDTNANGRTVTVSSGKAVISGGAVINEVCCGVSVSGSGSAEITGGTVRADSCIQVTESGNVVISGGTIDCLSSENEAVWVIGNSEVTVTGGEIKGYSGVLAAGGRVNIGENAKIGCTYTGIMMTNSSSVVDISGGEISALIGVAAATGSVTVSGSAKILGDMTNGRGVSGGSSIELGRPEITVNGGEISGKYGILAALSDVKITSGSITGGAYGVYVWTDSSTVINGGEINGGTYGMYVFDGSTDISGGKASGGTYGLYVKSGNAAVSGGEISGQCGMYVAGGSAVLSGGTFIGTVASLMNGVSGGTVEELLETDYSYFKGTAVSQETRISDQNVLAKNHMALSEGYGTITVALVSCRITTHPSSPQPLIHGYTDAPTLTVTAEKADRAVGELTYQWYQVGQDSDIRLEGATGSSYTVESGLDVGEYQYYCVVTCDGYSCTSKTASVTVNQTVTITVNEDNTTVTYNGSEIDLTRLFTVDGNAGEAVYTVINGTGEGTVSKDKLTVTKAGTFTVTVNTAPNGIYAAGTQTAVLTVNKGKGFGSVTIKGWAYSENANAPVPESTTNGTEKVSYLYESVDGDYSSENPPSDTGSYRVTAVFAENDLYEQCSASAVFSIAKKRLTDDMVSLTLDSPFYDGSVKTLVITVKDGEKLLEMNLDYTISGVTSAADVGTYTVTINGIGDYNGTVVQTWTIAGVDMNVSAEDVNEIYNGKAHSIIVIGVPMGASVTYSTDGKNYTAEKPFFVDAGTYKVYYRVEYPNYNRKSGSAKILIAKRPITVSGITALSKIYDKTTAADLDFTGVICGNIVEGDILSISADGVFDNENAGKQKNVHISGLALGGEDSRNYVLAEDGQQETAIADIIPKDITVTADNKTKVYKDADPALTFSAAGLVEKDELTGIILERKPGEDAGEYPITISQAENANLNYSITFTGAVFKIEKAKQAAPKLTGKAETIQGKADGTMKGLTTAMEYRYADDSIYTPVTDSDMTFAAGTWYVRYAGDKNYEASPDAIVEIAAGRMPGNISGNGTGNNTGNNSGNSTGNNTGNNSGNSTGNNTGNGNGNSTGNGRGNSTGNNMGNNPGNRTTDEGKAQTPKTGDNQTPWLWIALMLASAGMAAGTWSRRKKKVM